MGGASRVRATDGCSHVIDLSFCWTCQKQDHGNSETVKETLKAENEPLGKKVARNRGLHQAASSRLAWRFLARGPDAGQQTVNRRGINDAGGRKGAEGPP